MRSWIRCRRKAWLDLFGDKKERLWTAHRALQLDHQQRSVFALIAKKPSRGLGACKRGEEGVLGLRLKGAINKEIRAHAHPPMLQRIPGQSCWGNFAYRPVVARQGRRVTREQRLALSLIAALLEPLQEASIKDGLAVSIGINGLDIDRIQIHKGLKRQLLQALLNLQADLERDLTELPLLADRRKCAICSWRGFCNTEAAAKGDLSEISGIGPRRKEMLQTLGIKQIDDLALANPSPLGKKLELLGEQNRDITRQLVAQAKVKCYGYPERLDKSKPLPELDFADGVLIYDIESDPDAHEDFLHGFIQLKRKTSGKWNLENAKYHPILVLKEHGEAQSWKRLQRQLSSYPNWPILHYGETEAIAICRIAQHQGIQETELEELKKRFIDIHLRTRKYWLLPVKNYGLKAIASWTGFQWSQIGADGPRALLWWRQWKRHGQRERGHTNSLKSIFQYNQDDCLATWAVAEWLLNQD